MSNFLESCPGLAGSISRWIASDAHKLQPDLSVAAALAVLGTLKAQRVRSPSNLRTNNYFIAVAPSGSGKNHPLEKSKIIMAEAGATNVLFGQPTSDAGVVSGLAMSKGVGLILWDEFGQALKAITSKGTSIELSIIKILTEMFSSAGSVFVSKSYADAKQNKRINQPCLNLYASSTPERLLGALASGNVEDGFVGRFLFVPGESSPQLLGLSDPAVSGDILEGIKMILQAKKYHSVDGESEGNLARFFDIKPRIVPYTKDAWDFIQNLQKVQDTQMAASPELIQPIVARTLEHVIKVALTICDDKQIRKTDVVWASEFVTHCQAWLITRIRETMAAGDPGLLEDLILGFMAASGGICSDNELTKIPSYNRAKTKIRKEARDSLIDKGVIRKVSVVDNVGNSVPGYQLRNNA